VTFDLDIWCACSSWHYLGQFQRSGHRSEFTVTGGKMLLKWSVWRRVRAFSFIRILSSCSCFPVTKKMPHISCSRDQTMPICSGKLLNWITLSYIAPLVQVLAGIELTSHSSSQPLNWFFTVTKMSMLSDSRMAGFSWHSGIYRVAHKKASPTLRNITVHILHGEKFHFLHAFVDQYVLLLAYKFQ